MPSLLRRTLLLAAFAVFAPVAAAADAPAVYRCPDASGTTTFQQQPCPGGARVDASPLNIVEGDTEGDRASRERIAAESRLRAQEERRRSLGVRRHHRGDRARPRADVCFNEIEIKNAYTSANSITLSPRERAARLRHAQSLQPCR